MNLSEELQALLQSLAERLANEAQATVAVDRARLERQQAVYQQHVVEVARFVQLQVAHTPEMEAHRQLRLREVGPDEWKNPLSPQLEKPPKNKRYGGFFA